jgi:hypothetical protein
MTDWPISVYEHGPTIHPWSPESIGPALATQGEVLSGSTSGAWPSANRAYYIPFGLTKSITAKLMFVYNGATASGNFDIGIYDQAGRRLVSSGSTAQAGTNALQTVDITDTWIGPGLFYLALALDNTTGTVQRTSASLARQRLTGCFQQATAFALPATATFAAVATANIPVFGLCTRTVI